MLTFLMKKLGGDVTGIVSATFLAHVDLEKARRYVGRYPELLGARYLDKFEERALQSPELQNYILGRRALLRLCSEVGIERAFDIWKADVGDGLQLLHALIHTNSSEEMVALLRKHPGLTDEGAMVLLGRLIEADEFESSRELLVGIQTLLRGVRAIGIDALFADAAADPDIPGSIANEDISPPARAAWYRPSGRSMTCPRRC